MDAPDLRRPALHPAARSRRREARLAAALFWTVALLLVGARVALHDEIAAGTQPAPSGIAVHDARRAG